MPTLRLAAPVCFLAGDSMLFDDRLATVLRHAAQSEPGARTQYRQLLDLLGSMPRGAASELVEAGYDRLGELADALPQVVQSAILRAPGLRLRNRTLVAWLARGEPQAAAAAMATAQLDEGDWLYLIPRLPMTARGFLRHRRDLPFSARQVLERLGVKDLVLPEPDAPGALFPAPAERKARPEGDAEAEAGIGALVRRIEAFQRARRDGGTTPRLPLEETGPAEAELTRGGRAFDFATDVEGAVSWADPAMAPLVVGLQLGPPRPGAVAMIEAAAASALVRRLPLRGALATLAGPPEIAGDWRIDAAPVFAPATGQFAGYRGRMRRPAPAGARRAAEGTGDRMRQLLHELRTPVNAIQGFAELIQQQMFGSAPNEYRALAAAVAVDAARVMAGFDEIDRLAGLETGSLRLDEGECDLRDVVTRTLRRLEGVLRPRSARIELVARGSPFTVGMAEADAMQLAWRLLATLAGTLAPGEIVDLTLTSDGAHVTLEADLPAALAGNGDPFGATAPAQPRAVSAGMFGTGFTLRLARAEAESVGGSLEPDDDRLRLGLPALTASRPAHTQGRQGNGGPSAA
jgi:two-component system OmpR family sensor kinase